MKYTHLLVAVDLYEQEPAVLQYAQTLAQHYGTKLSVIHVMPHIITNVPYSGDFQAELEKETEKRLETLKEQVSVADVDYHLVHGSARHEIVSKANEVDADLIIIGSHGKHGVDLLLGSTASGVLHQANCDVLTIRIDAEDHPLHEGQYKRIVLATDFHEDCEKVTQKAMALAKEYQAEVYVINVVPEASSMASVYIPNVQDELKKAAQENMRQFAEQHSIASDHTKVVIGCPKHEILGYADEMDADMIVIGSHGRRLLSSIVLGSTAHSVLHGSTRDILVVRI